MLDGSPKASLIGVPYDKLDAAWPHVRVWIDKACERSSGRYTAEGFYERLMTRQQQLWVAWGEHAEAIAITEIFVYPDTGLKACLIIAVAGSDPERWTRFNEELCDWAKSQGCGLAETAIRPGLEPHMPSFRHVRFLVEKLL